MRACMDLSSWARFVHMHVHLPCTSCLCSLPVSALLSSRSCWMASERTTTASLRLSRQAQKVSLCMRTHVRIYLFVNLSVCLSVCLSAYICSTRVSCCVHSCVGIAVGRHHTRMPMPLHLPGTCSTRQHSSVPYNAYLICLVLVYIH